LFSFDRLSLLLCDADLQPSTTGMCFPKFHDFREDVMKGSESGISGRLKGWRNRSRCERSYTRNNIVR